MPSIATRGALSAKGLVLVRRAFFFGDGGRNSISQLGLGNITYYSSPKQVGALTTWLNIAGGRYFSIAIRS
jgi:hypothetical protein